MERYSPEPGEIIEDNITILKRSNHKRKRSVGKKQKTKDKRKHYRSRSKYSKSKSSSSITIKGSPRHKIPKTAKQEIGIEEKEKNEPAFFELNENRISSNDRLEERRKRIEVIRMKHQMQSIQKTPLTNEDVISINNDSSSNQQESNINNSSKVKDNTDPINKQQESFIKYIDQERELLTEEQKGNFYSLYYHDIVISIDPVTPDMFGDDPIEETLARKEKSQPINLSFYNQKESIGYYIPQLNEIIYSKYKVIGLCGKGVFSSVVKVLDIINNIEYALKIIRNIDIMKTSGDKEKSIISLLNKEDTEGKTLLLILIQLDKAHIIRLQDSFEFNNHLCMIIDLYQMNLRDLIKATRNDGVSINQVKLFAKQLIMGFILIHKNRLIHADCKSYNRY